MADTQAKELKEPGKQANEMPKRECIRLRSEPLIVSGEEAQKVFGVKIDKDSASFPVWRPREYTRNDFADRDELIIDHATGLIWQKSGLVERLTYQESLAYIAELNRQKFAGHEDWRLPTIPELMSLLEPEKQSNDLYINPIFDATQRWCWSADTFPSGGISSSDSAWYVGFIRGVVNWQAFANKSYVRSVRS
jgi:hypothetical protein